MTSATRIDDSPVTLEELRAWNPDIVTYRPCEQCGYEHGPLPEGDLEWRAKSAQLRLVCATCHGVERFDVPADELEMFVTADGKTAVTLTFVLPACTHAARQNGRTSTGAI